MIDVSERNRPTEISRRFFLTRSVTVLVSLGLVGCSLPFETSEPPASKLSSGQAQDPLSSEDSAMAESLKAVLIGSGIHPKDILGIKPIKIGPNQRLRTIDDEAEELWEQPSVRSSPDKLYNPRGWPEIQAKQQLLVEIKLPSQGEAHEVITRFMGFDGKRAREQRWLALFSGPDEQVQLLVNGGVYVYSFSGSRYILMKEVFSPKDSKINAIWVDISPRSTPSP